MEPFTLLKSRAIPLPMSNVDTDRIIPARFLHLDEGFGNVAFYDLRFQPNGELRQDSYFNHTALRDARILIGEVNFGCGSSREHAVWSLTDRKSSFHLKCIIASSFGDIFSSNSSKNGLLLVRLPEDDVKRLRNAVIEDVTREIVVNLEAQTVEIEGLYKYEFPIQPFQKRALLLGQDDIGFTLQFEDKIAAYETWSREQTPWLF